MKIFTKPDLLEALEKAGLPHSYKSLLAMERKGIIKRGGSEIKSKNDDRFYTQEEIKAIVETVKQHKNEIDE